MFSARSVGKAVANTTLAERVASRRNIAYRTPAVVPFAVACSLPKRRCHSARFRAGCRLAGIAFLRAAVGLAPLCAAADPNRAADFFSIKAVDAATGRGVPLVEFATVHNVSSWTDSAGRIAIHEPDLLGRKVFFHVRSHGYEVARDGFGNAGMALEVRSGESAEIKLTRKNIAERLYRITGQGIYRDTELLSLAPPSPANNGEVAGQDSTMAVVFRGRVYWFWGDTARLAYPLGNFRMSGATSELPQHGGLDPAIGIKLTYFTDDKGFTRAMWPAPKTTEATLTWSDGFLTVPDATGRECLVAHYTHRVSMEKMVEHGLSKFDEDTQRFEPLRMLRNDESWRFPKGHPVRGRGELAEYYLFRATGESHAPFLTIRAKARLDSIEDVQSYEAFTCLKAGTKQAERDASGSAVWGWTRGADPMTAKQEAKLISAGELKPEEARYQVRDVETRKPLELHAGSIRWNEFRKRWVMIVSQRGGTSFLGETWYSEADDPTGPWRWAKKIVTHDRQSFYNPVHHDFFDQDGGRLIYFEGTYTIDFSGNPLATPRYNYNQIMYRLDLADPRLANPLQP